MIITGKEALDLELSKETDFDESLFYKLDAGDSVSMVFLGGIGGIVSWVQHNWWKVDRYSKNPGGLEVTENVIFTCLKENWSDPKTVCPGCLFDDDGEQKWAATVLVQDGTELKEKVFFFGKAIWNGIIQVYRDVQSEFGDDEDINNKFLRLSNSGKGADRYSVSFMGKFFKEHATYEKKYNPIDYIKIPTFPEIVENMRNAGLPIDEKLAENNLNELGMSVEAETTE